MSLAPCYLLRSCKLGKTFLEQAIANGQDRRQKIKSAGGRDAQRGSHIGAGLILCLMQSGGSQLKSVKLSGKLKRWYQASEIGFCMKTIRWGRFPVNDLKTELQLHDMIKVISSWWDSPLMGAKITPRNINYSLTYPSAAVTVRDACYGW